MANGGTLRTDPESIPIATPEEITVSVDFAARLRDGESVTAVRAVRLRNVTTGNDEPLASPTGVASSSVLQVVNGAILQVGNRYQLVTSAVISDGRIEATITEIHVDF